MSKDKDQKKVASATATKEEKDKKSNLGALEEDDDFEEFPTEEWGKESEDPDDLQVWEEDWDDDDVEDDFSNQLKTELAKHGHAKK